MSHGADTPVVAAQPFKVGWWWKILQWLVSALMSLVFIALVFWQGTVTRDQDLVPMGFWGIVVFVLALFVTIIVHELGHAVAGWVVGMRLLMIYSGPVRLVREAGRLRWRVNTRSPAPGQVAMVPLTEKNLPKQVLWLLMGGVLANFLIGILFLAAMWTFNAPSVEWLRLFERGEAPAEYWMPVNITSLCLAILAVWNLGTAVINLIPGTLTPKLATDGTHLLWYRQYGALPLRYYLAMALWEICYLGVRPRLWDPVTLEKLLATPSDGTYGDDTIHAMTYYHALDQGWVEVAGRALDRALSRRELIPEAERPPLLMELAFFEAYHRRDAVKGRAVFDEAAAILKQTGIVLPQQGTTLRALGAVCLAEGKQAEAAKHLRDALGTLRRSPDRGGALAEREWLTAMLRECEGPIPYPSPARGKESDSRRDY
jgi:hypothetical protein